MLTRPRQATAEEATGLWPAVRAERIFDLPAQFYDYREAGPWRVRVSGRGEASVLGRWREHLDVLAIRGAWCSSRHVSAFIRDAKSLARAHELRRVLSPLLPLEMLGPYRREGLAVCQRIVAIQGHPRGVMYSQAPLGVHFRGGRAEDLDALAQLDAQCFDDFWRYGPSEVRELYSTERLVVAEDDEGQLIGYTLATVSRGAATLGRLAVASGVRRAGLGRALVAEVARWADSTGAETISLCTQEENTAARRLYASAGLVEVRDVYGFAMGGVPEKG